MKFVNTMPEGPEIRKMMKSLRRKVKGKSIYRVKSYNKKTQAVKSFDLPVKIIEVSCYGKKICFHLSNGGMLVSSPLMTGRWCYEEADYIKIKMYLADEVIVRPKYKIVKETMILYYSDMRSFGTMVFLSDKKAVTKYFSKFGPDILKTTVPEKKWLAIFRLKKNQKKEIAVLLLDQDQIAGIGNYLKSEILHALGISPHRLIEDLDDDEIEELRVASHKIIRESSEAGGLTISDYWSPDGKAGTFKVKVYGKKYDPEGNKVITDKDKKGRTNHWVKETQK